MLLKPTKDNDGSYGFRFQDNRQSEIASLYVVGYENRTLQSYSWNGMNRADQDIYIFQYTLAGRGMIEIGEKPYPLSSGDAFIVKVPSNHQYYLPNDSHHWEFIYITLKGQEALKCWDFIIQNFGSVLKLKLDSSLLQLLFNLYRDTANKKISDSFIASLRAYEFIMECYRYFKNLTNVSEEIPENIRKAVLYLKGNYHQPNISLEDIAQQANLSKHYFIKRFNECMNTSPLQYLTRVRIERAFILLRDTDITINEISQQVGYIDPNYFNKVFRRIVGTSPGQFRQNNYAAPFNHLIID